MCYILKFFDVFNLQHTLSRLLGATFETVQFVTVDYFLRGLTSWQCSFKSYGLCESKYLLLL